MEIAPMQADLSRPILYVEDDQNAREILRMMLVQKYPAQRFVTAENGLRGLEIYREVRPPIIITDINMPEMDGISMAAGIRALNPETIIIALTAHSETEKLIRAIEIGINHYVLKPLDFELFCAVLDTAIATVAKEQQLRDQYEQIRSLNDTLTAKADELESINIELEAFNYSVAHDLRSPLVSIGGFSQHLLDKYAGTLDEQGKECLRIIYKEALHMESLIEALLSFSSCSRKTIAKEWTDFSSIAHEVMGSLKLREPDRQATFVIADNVQVLADPVLSRVVLENLIGNAWKYTSHLEEAVIEFGMMDINGIPTCFVRDNGAGFDLLAHADKLFAPFQRLPGQKIKGHGIGLATVERIIKRHCGNVWAESTPGKGATFFFTLPDS